MPRTTLGRFLGGLSVSRLHGPEDEKYSLKGALTRVEVSKLVLVEICWVDFFWQLLMRRHLQQKNLPL